MADLTGKVIFSRNLTAQPVNVISVDGIANGVYIATITQDGIRQSVRLVVAK
jgi:NOL1/NOP2/fmu family ribosome biogenesis protein